ncbi:MAG: isoleucine--tRNA ligase [Buchnera aphidicola (Nurudea yanoniella)]
MTNYKSTLNLPHTNFSMKGNLSKKEIEILKKWKENNIYEIIRKTKQKKEKFFLHDGPPYANGNIHIGHAVNKILKDIIIKSKNMSGYNAPYTPSWDCHGLPIEHKIETINSKSKNKRNFSSFRNQCREYANQQVKNQKQEFIRLGILGDWEHAYLTMNFKNEARILKVFSKMIKLGYVYRDFKPVNWCTDCKSALAEAEVEYYPKSSVSAYIKFQALNDDIIKKIFKVSNLNYKIYIIIWTTTLWSLPANKAIALNPNFNYQLIETQKQILILSEKLTKKNLKKFGIKNWTILSTISGKLLENTKFLHPFLNINVPIVLSKHVTLDLGTGAVHIAPEFGMDDYKISKKYKISITKTIDGNGNYISEIHPKLNGINLVNSSKIIKKLLDKYLIKTEILTHNYPHCWRHRTPIIFRATQQWFIAMDHKNLRNNCIEQIKKVQWIPSWSKDNMINMISNRPDWCISRQRSWGVPITIFFHEKTGKLHPKLLFIIKSVIKDVKKNGIQSWFDINSKNLLGKESKDYIKTEDILDIWFESGSIMISDIYDEKIHNKNISDIYIEGSDQHRGWFMSSLIISTAINSISPYRTVITHGFAVDEKGKKMSKSIGNTIHPNYVIKKYGADILRLWVASTDYSKDLSISDIILKQISDTYRKIRNTARFLLSNLYDFCPKTEIISSKNMLILDRWAINKTLETQKKIIKNYENYNFHDVVKNITYFCSIEMSSFYLDIIKDRQYLTNSKNIARKSCQTTMYLILHALVRWITPILSFTADELWDHLPGKKEDFVFTEEWFKKLFYLKKEEKMNNQFWNTLIAIKTEVNKILDNARKYKKIGNSLESLVILYIDEDIQNMLKLLKNELKFLFLVSKIQIKNYYSAPHYATKSKFVKHLKIYVEKINGIKCMRCWHIISKKEDIDNKLKICKRCVSNVKGPGENRRFL